MRLYLPLLGFVLGALSPSVVAAPPVPEHVHVVQPGDTLIGLRARLLQPQVRIGELQRRNGVSDPRRLQPGRTLRWPETWLRERPAEAEVLHVHGAVWVLRAGRREPATAGLLLREGDGLESGAQSSATLRFVDGARSLVRPDSRLSLRTLRQSAGAVPLGRTAVQLDQGALDTVVPPHASAPRGTRSAPRFELRTPVAQLGVRGTQFRGRWQGQSLALEVLAGRVEANSAQHRDAVTAGQGWWSGSGTEALLPPPDLQALHARRLERLPLQLAWPSLPGAQAWRVQLLDADGQALLLDATPTAPAFLGAAELPDGAYRLRVRAVSASGLEGRDAEVPVLLSARPEPPLLQSPAAQAQQYAPSVAFAWTRSAEAGRYRLQVADEAGFARPRLDQSVDAGTRWDADLPEGLHHWRVASVRADGRQGPWSDVQTLTRLAPPPSPPPAEQARDGDTLQLRWAASTLAGARYQVQVSRQASFATPWTDETLDAPTLTLRPTEGGVHHLRVRTLAPDGTPGPWGAPQQFDWPRSHWWLWLLPTLFLL